MTGGTDVAPRAERIAHWVSDGILRLAGLWFLCMICLGVYNVASRYLFGRALLWADEAALLSLIVLTWLGAVVSAWRASEIRMDILLAAVPARPRRALRVLHEVVTALLLGWLSVLSLHYVLRAYDFGLRSDAMRFPMWLVHAAIPLSLVCIALIACFRIWRLVAAVHPLAEGASR
ncbi:MAG: TRAP transporter small permease [Rhodobacteraceae bacterium]|nr:TRAP transporter small permease [Paracoccaceae bacterium]MBR9821022.1 TRAP transporter small permease [Paracoccaceae bacterium]